MRYTVINTDFIQEIQFSISISAVPVPIWCWVSRARQLTEEDLSKTSQIIKLAFDDELALAGNTSPGLWRIKEIGVTKTTNRIYIGNLCSSSSSTKPRFLGSAQLSKATTPTQDYMNEFLFNEVHNFNVTTAKAFPLSEHLQHNAGPHSYAISLLFTDGTLNDSQYNSVNNLSRSFLASIESYLLGLHHGVITVIKDLISQEIHQLLCALTQIIPPQSLSTSLCPNPIRQSLAPLHSILPSAFCDLCTEYESSAPVDPPRTDTDVPVSLSPINDNNNNTDTTLLSFKNHKDLLSHLQEFKEDVITSYYVKLEPSSQGIRLSGSQVACNYCISNYNQEQYESILKVLDIYHQANARFMNLVMSNLCCADFRIVYLGPYVLVKLINDTVATLLPEDKRQIFKKHSIHIPLDATYCNCTDSSQTLLLEHKPAISSCNVLYNIVKGVSKDDSRRFKHSNKKTDHDQDSIITDSPSKTNDMHDSKDNIHGLQGLDMSGAAVCPHCRKPLYIPKLHVDASSQVLSTDMISGQLALQQFCAATGKPLCVVNLLAHDLENLCFIISHSPIPYLQKFNSQRYDKIFQSKRNHLLILSSKAPNLYSDEDSTFYYHLFKRLLIASQTIRRFILNCRLLRLQYYFSSVMELALLDYIQFIAQNPTKSPLPSSKHTQTANPSGLKRIPSAGGLALNIGGTRNLAKAPSVSKLADFQPISELFNTSSRLINAFSRASLSIKTLYLALPISRQRITSVCQLEEHSLCRLNSAFTLHDSNHKEEPIIHILLTNGFRSVGSPDVCLPISDTAKWAQICSGTFSISKLSCLIRLRSTDQIITSDLIPFGIATITNHQIVVDKDEFQHTSLAMKYGILGA